MLGIIMIYPFPWDPMLTGPLHRRTRGERGFETREVGPAYEALLRMSQIMCVSTAAQVQRNPPR
jgi:hypothetical protein